MGELAGKVVLVTGGSGPLGSAVGRAFRAVGARLVVAERNRAKLESAWGGQDDVLIAAAELADAAAVERMVAAAIERFGRIDVLVHAAGGFRGGKPVHETPLEDLDAMWASHGRAVFVVSRAVVPWMLRQGAGAIVTVAAEAALAGGANLAAYSAAKSAALRITESLAAELRPRGIRVNAVLPRTIDTPANRAAMPDADPREWVSPAAIADLILFLASSRARAVHGAAIPALPGE